MKLIMLGIITTVLTLILLVFRFTNYESEVFNKLFTFGNYSVVILALYVTYEYVKNYLLKKRSKDESSEKWDGIGAHVTRIPLVIELAFIAGILAMVWYNTVGFHIQVFSNIAHWNEEIVEHKLHVDSKIAQADKEDLLTMGKKLYLVQCASCHGRDGKGQDGKAQDHTKRMSKESVLNAIHNGTHNFTKLYPAGMPGGFLKGGQAKEVAIFVAEGMEGKKPKAWSACATCHNENGEGINFVAPNIKTYTDDLVRTVLTNGKKGVIGTMPNFTGRFSENQMRALATYIRSLGE